VISSDIATQDTNALARQSLADAAMALTEIAAATRVVADALRSVDVSPGVSDLQALTESLLTVFQVVAAASAFLKHEAGAAEQEQAEIDRLTVDLSSQTTELIEAQQSGDWLRLSEALEFDLEPLLLRWRDALLKVATS